MKLKELVEKYGEQEVLCWAERADESLEWVNIKLEPPKPKTVWDFKNGDEYYYITSDGDSHYEGYWNDDYDVPIARRKYGNVFLTKEEAEQEIERREVEALLLKYGGRKWFNGHNHNFHIGLDDYEEHLKVYILMTPTQGTIYFDTSARAEKAISEIGEERLKKALFEVR